MARFLRRWCQRSTAPIARQDLQITGGSRGACDTLATRRGTWRAAPSGQENTMRAIGSNAPSVEPWMGAAGPGGTINAIVPPVNVKSGPVRVADDAEHEGRTIPFERI